MADHLRLSPTMASRKLQALAFIEDFCGRHGVGPSLGEIAGYLSDLAGHSVSRQSARDLRNKLARDGRIHFIAGKHRSITLPDSSKMITRMEAIRRLKADGFLVDEDAKTCVPTLTNAALARLVELDD